MKSYKRFLSLFLCLPLLFVAFSTTASAESVDTDGYKVNIVASEALRIGSFGQVNILNGESSTIEQSISKKLGTSYRLEFYWKLTFADTGGTPMFQANKTYHFTASNLYCETGIPLANGSTWISSTVDEVSQAYVVYSDGSTEGIDVTIIRSSINGLYSIQFDFTPSKDVTKVYVELLKNYSNDDLHSIGTLFGTAGNVSMVYGTGSGYNLGLTIDVKSEELGFLASILQWIKDIANSIIELPSKIWSFIENGLKGLFVPDQEYMSSYKDKWDELLSSRLGAVYQVCSIVTESWDGIINADQTNTIALPLVSLPFGDSTFSFGGQDVEIVPAGFEVLVDALKLIIGIVCTYLFINGLLKRYDEVMGVEK